MSADRSDPTRTCVACRVEGGKQILIRFVRSPDGSIHQDLTGRAPGRGAYLHDDGQCRELARRRRSLERALRPRPARTG